MAHTRHHPWCRPLGWMETGADVRVNAAWQAGRLTLGNSRMCFHKVSRGFLGSPRVWRKGGRTGTRNRISGHRRCSALSGTHTARFTSAPRDRGWSQSLVRRHRAAMLAEGADVNFLTALAATTTTNKNRIEVEDIRDSHCYKCGTFQ